MYHSRNVIRKITVSYHHEVITPKLLYHPKILLKGYHQQDILPKISPIKIMSQRGHTQNTNSKKALKDTVSIKKISQGGHPTAETITALSREWDAFKETIRRNPFIGKHIYHEKKILRIKFGVIKKKNLCLCDRKSR